jgi:hypothetical protein
MDESFPEQMYYCSKKCQGKFTVFFMRREHEILVWKFDLLLHSESKMVMWWSLWFSVAAQNMAWTQVGGTCFCVSLCAGEWGSTTSKRRHKFFLMLVSWIEFHSRMCAGLKFILSGDWMCWNKIPPI